MHVGRAMYAQHILIKTVLLFPPGQCVLDVILLSSAEEHAKEEIKVPTEIVLAKRRQRIFT